MTSMMLQCRRGRSLARGFIRLTWCKLWRARSSSCRCALMLHSRASGWLRQPAAGVVRVIESAWMRAEACLQQEVISQLTVCIPDCHARELCAACICMLVGTE